LECGGNAEFGGEDGGSTQCGCGNGDKGVPVGVLKLKKLYGGLFSRLVIAPGENRFNNVLIVANLVGDYIGWVPRRVVHCSSCGDILMNSFDESVHLDVPERGGVEFL